MGILSQIATNLQKRAAACAELTRIKQLKAEGFPGWESRIAQLECFLYGRNCSPRLNAQVAGDSFSNIPTASGFPPPSLPSSSGTTPAPIRYQLGSGQVTITDSATLICPYDATRESAVLESDGANTFYVGSYLVKSSTGKPVDPGEALTLSTSAEIWGILVSGKPAQVVTYISIPKEL